MIFQDITQNIFAIIALKKRDRPDKFRIHVTLDTMMELFLWYPDSHSTEEKMLCECPLREGYSCLNSARGG